jgi:hypothetical protein
LAAGLGEREIAEFVEDDDVEASEIVGDASLASGCAVPCSRRTPRMVAKNPRMLAVTSWWS